MKVFHLPEKMKSLFAQEQAVFWFSSQELFFWWDKKKKKIPLPHNSGFLGGQVADLSTASETITYVCQQEGLSGSSFLSLRKATVFISAASSPLERQIVRRAFQSAGFQKISLVAYTTALRAFAERQAIRSGAGVYIGNDVSEAVVFSPNDQQLFSLSYSLSVAHAECQRLLRQTQQLEISMETAEKLYSTLGKKKEKMTFPIRGRNIQTNQIETRSLATKDMMVFVSHFEKKLAHELTTLTASPLFGTLNPDHWVIVGDELLNAIVQEKHATETVFLASEQEMIQGVQWL